MDGLLLGKPTFALDRGANPELAMYAAYPGQLKIYPDMSSLVKDLADFLPPPAPSLGPISLGSAEYAIDELLHIYAQPSGAVLGQKDKAQSYHSHEEKRLEKNRLAWNA